MKKTKSTYWIIILAVFWMIVLTTLLSSCCPKITPVSNTTSSDTTKTENIEYFDEIKFVEIEDESGSSTITQGVSEKTYDSLLKLNINLSSLVKKLNSEKSFLKTKYATSEAYIFNGNLYHNITNIKDSIPIKIENAKKVITKKEKITNSKKEVVSWKQNIFQKIKNNAWFFIAILILVAWLLSYIKNRRV